MSEILKQAFEKPRAINQNKFHHMVNKGLWPKYIWDFYPLAQDYYHEFNPYFVHLIPKTKLIPFFDVFTVRDGAYTFADFMVKNLKDIASWKTQFLVPEHYAGLIPEIVREKFLSYSTSQVKKPDIKKAKSVVIFTFTCEQYFGDLEKLEEKLSVLKDLSPETKVEVCLCQRRNPLLTEEAESFNFILIPELIRKSLGKREIHWLKLRELMDKTHLSDTLLIDLMDGTLLTCDSYLHFWFLNRGGMIQDFPVWEKEKTLFDLDLNLSQKLHVKRLPDVESQAAELIFFSKTTKENLWNHPLFHEEVKKIIDR